MSRLISEFTTKQGGLKKEKRHEVDRPKASAPSQPGILYLQSWESRHYSFAVLVPVTKARALLSYKHVHCIGMLQWRLEHRKHLLERVAGGYVKQFLRAMDPRQ
jgi:hypothetical protein